MSALNVGERVRILLADDHEIVRRGLRDLLTQIRGWEVCGEAATGREAVDMAINMLPNVAIIDLTMPQLNGLEATRQIKKAAPTVEVLIYTVHESEQLIREVLAAGARGYLLKSDDLPHIISAIDALIHRRPFLTWKASETLLDSFVQSSVNNDNGDTGDPLTPREREIVQLLAEGCSSKRVSSLLGITVATVDSHRATIMRKLDAHSIVQIVHYAIRNSLVKPGLRPTRSPKRCGD